MPAALGPPGRQSHIKPTLVALAACSRTFARPPLPTTIPFRHLPSVSPSGTDHAINSSHLRPYSNQRPSAPRLVPALKRCHRPLVHDRVYKELSDPVLGSSSPASLTQDFARQQVSHQQRSRFHSSFRPSFTVATMVSQSVNKTGLHPAGVQ